MDDAEQQRIEKKLRGRLAKPRYPPSSTCPVPTWSMLRVRSTLLAKIRSAVRHLPEPRLPTRGRPGIVEHEKVRCEMPLGHDGPHSLAPGKRRFSKSYWEARQWRSKPLGDPEGCPQSSWS